MPCRGGRCGAARACRAGEAYKRRAAGRHEATATVPPTETRPDAGSQAQPPWYARTAPRRTNRTQRQAAPCGLDKLRPAKRQAAPCGLDKSDQRNARLPHVVSTSSTSETPGCPMWSRQARPAKRQAAPCGLDRLDQRNARLPHVVSTGSTSETPGCPMWSRQARPAKRQAAPCGLDRLDQRNARLPHVVSTGSTSETPGCPMWSRQARPAKRQAAHCGLDELDQRNARLPHVVSTSSTSETPQGWHSCAMPGSAKGRKSSSAPTKGKAVSKGSGHTHVQAETTPAEAGVLDLQSWVGNRRVAAMLTVSRQPAPPNVKPAGPATDPKFDKTRFQSDNGQFELDYKPNGPMPVKGDVTVTLRVHIDFKDFTRADM